MDKLKMILKDNTFIRHTFFIVFNAILLYILYFLIKKHRFHHRRASSRVPRAYGCI